jgi:hypothetical protein
MKVKTNLCAGNILDPNEDLICMDCSSGSCVIVPCPPADPGWPPLGGR